jgi:disulfide bond formation protein DsbB
MSFEKSQRPLFARFGIRSHVTNDTTALSNNGHTHIDTTGVYTLAAPSVGIMKSISLAGNDTAHGAAAFTIQTNSSAVTFAGTTFNSFKSTTDLNTGTNANPVAISLIGMSTASWAITNVLNSSGVTIAGTTQV